MKEKRFVTAVNCMDGRVQLPVIEWLKRKYRADYVDMVTEPGPIKILTEKRFSLEATLIKSKLEISVKKHGSKLIAIVGHFDCAGDPVDKEVQLGQIKGAMETIVSWGLNAKLIGLWVDEHGQVQKVF